MNDRSKLITDTCQEILKLIQKRIGYQIDLTSAVVANLMASLAVLLRQKGDGEDAALMGLMFDKLFWTGWTEEDFVDIMRICRETRREFTESN